MRALWFVVAVVASSACAAPEETSDDRSELERVLDEAALSLAESIDVALVETQADSAHRAALVLGGGPLYSVVSLYDTFLQEVRIDTVTSELISVTAAGTGTAPCPGAISLREAVAIAAAALEGDAVSAEPEDDDPCHFEVKVMSDRLYEVILGSDGAVLEQQFSAEMPE